MPESGRGGVAAVAAALALVALSACRPSPPNDVPATPLPTRQTTIDPVTKKLDAAQAEAERRRVEAERAGQ